MASAKRRQIPRCARDDSGVNGRRDGDPILAIPQGRPGRNQRGLSGAVVESRRFSSMLSRGD